MNKAWFDLIWFDPSSPSIPLGRELLIMTSLLWIKMQWIDEGKKNHGYKDTCIKNVSLQSSLYFSMLLVQ